MENLQTFASFIVVSLLIRSVFTETGEAATKSFLINCGTNATVNVSGRRWVGDLTPGNNVTLSSPGVSASTLNFSGDLTCAPLYRTARIFTDDAHYMFEKAQGSYFLRLHFYSSSLEGHNANESSFSVVANGLKLMSEFKFLTETENSGGNASLLVKEYFLTVDPGGLSVSIIPGEGSFGFVNAIELVPVSGSLFVGRVSEVGDNGASGDLNLRGRGLETMFRLNVGGREIKPYQDASFWRKWEVDSGFMLKADAGTEMHNSSVITYASSNDTSVAPLPVYETARIMSNVEILDKRFNMSWKFFVDPGFDYLIRLHFCELVFEKANERSFRIYINNRTAANGFDVFARAGGVNKAYHQDYFDQVPPDVNTLWIQLGPDTAAAGSDALLNGLEIFKLSRNGNLAYVLRDFKPRARSNKRTWALWVGVGVGFASFAVLGVSSALIFYRCKSWRNVSGDSKKFARRRTFFSQGATLKAPANLIGPAGGNQNPNESVGSNRAGKQFTISEIRVATNNFDENVVIGVGGFGKVYKGETDDGELVAIKRAHPRSQQGLAEFETEIEMLSKLRHRHLVSLIGFCEEQNEMILVYEYMANGTLRSHLFGSDMPPLSWKQRLQVCIGAARGLHYLHTGAEHGIIHRDVKTTNILLDDTFVAKVADFGLSKTGPLEHTHVSTAVKGSFGYLDPEYFRRQQLTEKSDIYSFGVVLFEVVCARAVINPTLPKDQINLAEWALRWQREGSLGTIVDPHLKDKYCPKSFKKFAEIAEKCLADEGKQRPTMGEVLWHLEYVLQVHEAWMHSKSGGENCISSGPVSGHPEVEILQEQKLAHIDIDTKLEMMEEGEPGS